MSAKSPMHSPKGSSGCLAQTNVGFQTTHRAVKGHEFGLDLNAQDKAELIAFLKTL